MCAMRLGGRAWFAAAALAAAACLVPAPAQAACGQGDDEVLAQNAYVRVVGERCTDAEGTSYFDVRAGLRGGTPYSLDYSQDDDIEVHSLKLRGRYVAYLSSWSFEEEQASVFAVMNARTGAIHELDSNSVYGPDAWGGYVLKPNGSSAWIVDDAFGDEFSDDPAVVVRRCPRATCLRADPRTRRPTTVDDAPGIAFGSLRLSGSKISWMRGGVRRRATLR